MNKITKLSMRAKVLVLIVVIIIISLAVWGLNNKNHKSTTEQSVSKVTTTGNKSKTIKLSDALKSKEQTVWYEFDTGDGTLRRDTVVRSLYVVKNGYMTVYNLLMTGEYLKVSDINKLSDSEIIAKAKKINRDYEEDLVNNIKGRIEKNTFHFSENATDEQKASALSSLNAIKYKAPTPQKIKITATNNGQNKTPIKETINFSKKSLYNDGKVIGSDSSSHSTDTQIMNEKYVMKDDPDTIDVSGQSQYNAEIDGQKYNGFANELMTKVKSANIIFALDTEKGSLISKNTGSDE